MLETGFLPESHLSSPYMVMDRVGRSLKKFLMDSGGQLCPRMTFRVALGMTNVLEEIHSLGWVHRDIKLRYNYFAGT